MALPHALLLIGPTGSGKTPLGELLERSGLWGRPCRHFDFGERMRRIALQSAVGGMALSVLAMLVAAAGYLPPVAGAVTQEAIDVLSILNALRAAVPPRQSRDF